MLLHFQNSSSLNPAYQNYRKLALAHSLRYHNFFLDRKLTGIPFSFQILFLLFTPLEFFPSVLADGFPLEFDWQQVSSSLQD